MPFPKYYIFLTLFRDKVQGNWGNILMLLKIERIRRVAFPFFCLSALSLSVPQLNGIQLKSTELNSNQLNFDC